MVWITAKVEVKLSLSGGLVRRVESDYSYAFRNSSMTSLRVSTVNSTSWISSEESLHRGGSVPYSLKIES
ncbi:MAG: hypothetical protein NZ992_03855 [Candidatus Korarchaeum sp.]|nr:hypothetical protein [Candidatus Korarchaeum sp.]MDW8035138.1 hypothetical protein [Candidatus Korarchaeum sp.]